VLKVHLSCLSKDSDGVENGEQKKARAKEEETKQNERKAGVGNVSEAYNCSIPIQQKAAATPLAAQEHQEKEQNIKELLS
jgi:hypothetical protein